MKINAYICVTNALQTIIHYTVNAREHIQNKNVLYCSEYN